MIDLRAAALIAVCAGVTMLLRFLPFLVFGGKKEVPGYITYLSGVLPYAIMGMLVVYCLKNVDVLEGNRGLPELIAILSPARCTSGSGRCSCRLQAGRCAICCWCGLCFEEGKRLNSGAVG